MLKIPHSLALIGLLLLGGCASLHSHRASVVPSEPESAPFVLNGRISIDFPGEHHSAGLYWNHQTQSDEILLLTPFGQTVARITSDVQHATLDQGGQHFQADDAGTLMVQVLGWHLPLSGLHHWVLGKDANDSPAQIERDEHGRVSVLRQADWEVRYLSYAEATPESLPSRLQLTHADLQVKLFIDEWDWNASSQEER